MSIQWWVQRQCYPLQEFRALSNQAYERGDYWWFSGLLIWSISIAHRWAGDDGSATRWIWFCSHAALCVLPILLKGRKPAFYRKFRIPLLVSVRFLRLLGVHFALSFNQNAIWPQSHASATACLTSLFLAQYFKLAYLICQSLAHQIPLKHHIWLVTLNAAVTVLSLPGRCKFDCTSSTFSNCSMVWAEKLSRLGRLWAFAAEQHLQPVRLPWEACFIVESFLMVREKCCPSLSINVFLLWPMADCFKGLLPC